MKYIRASVRILAFLVFTVGSFYIICLLTPKSWKYPLCRFWARACARSIGMKIKVYGTAPKPPFFLVTNHLSYLDIMFLWTQVDAVFVSKKEVKKWPLIGAIARALGTIFIDRNSRKDLPRVNEQITRALAEGHGVIVFPEGTISNGSDVLPFRTSLLAGLALRQDPVHVAFLSYQKPSDGSDPRETVCWSDTEVSFLGHFYRLAQISSFEAHLYFGQDVFQDPNRKVLAGKLHAHIKQLQEASLR